MRGGERAQPPVRRAHPPAGPTFQESMHMFRVGVAGGIRLHKLESDVADIRNLARFLEASAKRLDSTYASSTAGGWPRGFAVSMIKPTVRGDDQPIAVKHCEACGKQSGKLNSCSRCMAVFYCSRYIW